MSTDPSRFDATAQYPIWYQNQTMGEPRGDLTAITHPDPMFNSTSTSSSQSQAPSATAAAGVNSNADTNATASVSAATRTSVPVACVACRSRHLKCDGGAVCSRCRAEGVACSYVKSRRGWKGPRRKLVTSSHAATGQHPSLITPQAPQASPQTSGVVSPLPPFSLKSALSNIRRNSANDDAKYSNLSQERASPATSLPSTRQIDRLRPDDVFMAYHYFFDTAHPFLLPHGHLMKLLQEGKCRQLELAVRFVGSTYISTAPTDDIKGDLLRMLTQQPPPPQDRFTVQALMIFAISLHAQNEPELAVMTLYSAISLALEIGMHRSEFALRNSSNDIERESWTRTWWSLYIINGFFAAVNPKVEFRLRDIVTDVPLPCEDEEYLSGTIPPPRTLQDYDDAPFTGEDEVFSSFTYLIDAVRIVGRVLHNNEETLEYEQTQYVDSCLVNWSLHLPETKKAGLISGDGQHFDELLFQAHAMINAGTMLLHRPRSSLGCVELQKVTRCTPPGLTLYPRQGDIQVHTAKAIEAAENVSKLMALPVSLQRHTCFFTCIVVMASVVHLAYWSWIVPDGEDTAIKEFIRLDTGVLKHLSVNSRLARAALREVHGVAKEMLLSKRTLSNHMWSSIANQEIFRDVIEVLPTNELELIQR